GGPGQLRAAGLAAGHHQPGRAGQHHRGWGAEEQLGDVDRRAGGQPHGVLRLGAQRDGPALSDRDSKCRSADYRDGDVYAWAMRSAALRHAVQEKGRVRMRTVRVKPTFVPGGVKRVIATLTLVTPLAVAAVPPVSTYAASAQYTVQQITGIGGK